jgi:hypothetical protein
VLLVGPAILPFPSVAQTKVVKAATNKTLLRYLTFSLSYSHWHASTHT